MSDGRTNNRISTLEKQVGFLQNAIYRLEALCDPRKHDKEPIPSRDDTAQESHSAARTLTVVVESPKNPKTTSKEAKKAPQGFFRRNILGRWRTLLQSIGILAGIGYAVLTYMQWSDLRRNFTYTERAWIKVVPRMPKDASSETLVFNISNLGKSVAVNTAINVWIEVVPHDSPIDLKETEVHGVAEYGLIFPGDTPNFPANRINPDTRKTWSFTEEEKSDLISGKSYLLAHGIATYHDQFGNHWTRFCAWKGYGYSSEEQESTVAYSYDILPCVRYGSVGDGEIPPPNY